MRVFKIKAFHRWAARERLTDATLRAAAEEIAEGLVDADLGGHVVKKRAVLPGRGKSGGVRTLVAFKRGDRALFLCMASRRTCEQTSIKRS